MSEQDEELELQALQRQLDDAFATTRPRAGFDDELWARMQARRPFSARARAAFGGFLGGARKVQAAPLAALAGVLIVVIGVGILEFSGAGRGGGGGASTALNAEDGARRTSGAFGAIPGPASSTAPKTGQNQGVMAPEYLGPAQLVWTGNLTVAMGSAPVYRYREPSANAADQFAAALGAALRDRPQGFLGSYSSTTYTLQIRGTLQSPPSSPAYFILANSSMPAINAAGAGPQDQASIFLAQHNLTPPWPYTVSVDSTHDPIRVIFERQFDVPGYGAAHLVDSNGVRYGLEVDLTGGRPVTTTGLLPVSLDRADYRIISAGEAIRQATTPSSVATTSPLPTVQLTQAEIVYLLVPAGAQSYYEPAFLFSGAVTLNGATMIKHVLVPAVDPSQRTS